jgi:hypothetical protein
MMTRDALFLPGQAPGAGMAFRPASPRAPQQATIEGVSGGNVVVVGDVAALSRDSCR